jgi:hypothetical protein
MVSINQAAELDTLRRAYVQVAELYELSLHRRGEARFLGPMSP